MRYPNFICLGAQKAGTTSIYEILKQHSEIFLPDIKEAPFFREDKHYNAGIEQWMKANASRLADEKIIGMISPELLYYDFVPERIKKTLGSKPKFLVILRDPASRAYSHYLMSVRKGFEKESFEEAMKLESNRINKDLISRDIYSYLDRGRYAEQIERYLEFIPKEQILFLSFEKDIKQNLGDTVMRLQQFLEVEFEELDWDIKSNPSRGVHSKAIQKFVRGRSILKKPVKALIPDRVIFKIKEKIIEFNESKAIDRSKLSNEERKTINLKYFSDQPAKLKDLTGLDFGYWLK